MSLLLAQKIDLTIPGQPPIQILHDLDLELHAGESLAVIGCSGAGKSTLLQILGLLQKPTAGRILHAGEEIPWHQAPLWRNRHIGFVFQGCHLLESMTPLENVLMPASIAREPTGRGAPIRQRACDLLESMGLGSRISTPCRVLSGGEKQRVAIARALIMEPLLILADEPSGNLDPRTGRVIQDLLLQQVSPTRALLVVTHDHQLANRCSRTLQLADGHLISVETPSHVR